jgi:hypothetical protein
VSARAESAIKAQPNPRRPMTLVRTSKWSVSIGSHLESDERRLWQRGTLTAAYLGVGNRPRAVPRSPVEPRSAARRGCGGEFLRGIRQGRLRRELRRQGNTGMDHFHPGALALLCGPVWAPGFRAARRRLRWPMAPRSGPREPRPVGPGRWTRLHRPPGCQRTGQPGP